MDYNNGYDPNDPFGIGYLQQPSVQGMNQDSAGGGFDPSSMMGGAGGGSGGGLTASSGAGMLGSIGGAVGSLLGDIYSAPDRAQAQGLLGQGAADMRGLDPTMTAQQAGPSAFQNLQVNGTGSAAQMAALDQLQKTYQAGGLDPQAQSDIYATEQQGNQQAQALNSQVAQNAAQRGVSGGGAMYAAQRQNAQNSSNAAKMQGLQALSMGYQRQMQALNGAGALGSTMQGQANQQADDRARAMDAISTFNANQRQGANQATFNNGYYQAQGLAGLSPQYSNLAGQTMQMWGAGGKALGSAAGSIAGAAAGAGG